MCFNNFRKQFLFLTSDALPNHNRNLTVPGRCPVSHIFTGDPLHNLTEGGGFSVRFLIGMLSTARWLKLLQRVKKGVETIHFAKFWRKRGRNKFSSSLLKYWGRNHTNFPKTWKRGSKWRSICSSLHRLSTLPGTRPPIRFQVIIQNNPPRPTQSHLNYYCNLLYNLVWGSAAVLQTHLHHLK